MPSFSVIPTFNPCIHFVGFKGNEYNSAVKIWGNPDFYHRVHDLRAQAEFMKNDIVIFANGTEHKFTPYTFDDSKVF